MIVVTAAEMRAIDRLAIERYGVPGPTLMENAGRAVVRAILKEFPQAKAGRVLVVAGKGNNGGDGFVVARLLRRQGVKCSVTLLAERSHIRGDAALKLAQYTRAHGRLTEVAGSDRIARLQQQLNSSTLVVDALLGTGLSGDVRGLAADAIELINSCGIPVVSVDIPSGLDSERGVPLGTCVQAELTVTLAAPKLGLLLYPGAQYAGRLLVADIGIPPQAPEEVAPQQQALVAWELGGRIAVRAPDSHKGTYGHLAIIAGSRGKTGAAILCGRAAQRAGAGLVTVACPAALNAILETALLEVMTHPLADAGRGELGKAAGNEITALLEGKRAVVVGPGLGAGEEQRSLVRSLVAECRLPVLIDADGLNCLAGSLRRVDRAPAPRILTPHPGEMARLTGRTSLDVQADRVNLARSFATRHRCFLVLKGARTLVASPNGMVSINLSGNPGLASGGSGDVLAGVIGALLAQQYKPEDACQIGVFLHGYAADIIAEERGTIGMLASDLIDRLPEAFFLARQEFEAAGGRDHKMAKQLS